MNNKWSEVFCPSICSCEPDVSPGQVIKTYQTLNNSITALYMCVYSGSGGMWSVGDRQCFVDGERSREGHAGGQSFCWGGQTQTTARRNGESLYTLSTHLDLTSTEPWAPFEVTRMQTVIIITFFFAVLSAWEMLAGSGKQHQGCELSHRPAVERGHTGQWELHRYTDTVTQ